MIVMEIEVFLSITMGSIFLVSAVSKLRHPKSFILAVLEYRVLPPRLSRFLGYLIPPLEFFIALLMLTGIAVRSVAVIMSLLLISFIIAMSINLVRGRDLDCHCFGEITRRPIGWRTMLQDGLLFGAALTLVIIPRQWFAPESWSVFRLSRLVPVDSLMLPTACVLIAACIVMLLIRTTWSQKWYRSGAIKK